MSITLFLAAALSTPAPVTLTVPAPTVEKSDVGYHELLAGRPEAAIASIEKSGLARAGDPLALINLGTAYKMLGRKDEAQRLYKAAVSSDDRFDVELGNGRWVDSRRAANIALNQLGSSEVLALR
ncbi:tetratricopeptide repeat protein [Novosphingobium sp. SL115]|uniref:tetratricopeptide repeat protein n=1 Tax=Novosphingobium sp. SL115 TaxID=2995150 RepID=UPI00227477DA|nr:tetratricopeptide repeat protein [Novosphingobium sp. SL115]MCY1672635.1 tetratricopeptide repeat protein [Novosphingobium sp. SL115]